MLVFVFVYLYMCVLIKCLDFKIQTWGSEKARNRYQYFAYRLDYYQIQ